jgi:NAD(P)-dependent dehydrogenase (short-subunit alcohol dehydrogenase family)
VLVTGAMSGIGRKTTVLLSRSGFFVYATARKDDDLKALAAIPNVQPIRLDVTKQDQIDAAVKTVQEGGRGLFGLINNAGVAVLAPLIEVTEKDFAFQLDANVYGPYRVTKAFAPLLIESKGRVLTTGSISELGLRSGVEYAEAGKRPEPLPLIRAGARSPFPYERDGAAEPATAGTLIHPRHLPRGVPAQACEHTTRSLRQTV